MKTSIRFVCFVLSVMLFCATSVAQVQTGGYVLGVEDGHVYIDLGASKVAKGAVLDVVDANGGVVGQIVVESTFGSYSSARPVSGLSGVAAGMKVAGHVSVASPAVATPASASGVTPLSSPVNHDSRVSVIVPPAQVNDVVGVGHFGGYVADLLMEQLMMCPEVRLIDRSLFNAQIDEAELGGSYIDPATAIEKGKIAGARYAVQVTMQKPDVANVRTGIPLASIMGALQGGLNRNIGAQYMSNMEVARLKASVSLSARVIDIQTGEVMFMTSGNGKAEGDVQLGMEYGALGGAKLNDGADGFKQTVTGKAIQKAFMTVGRHLDTYFSGRATSKVMGSASGYGRFDERLDRRGMSLYSGVNKLSNDDVYSLFYDNKHLYFKYRSAKNQLRWSKILLGVAALGAVTTVVGLVESDSDLYFLIYAGPGITVASVIPAVILNISARKKVESIKNEYNNKMYSSARDMDYSLDLVAADNGGLGLRFSF